MIAISDFILNEGSLSVLGRTAMSSLPTVSGMGGLLSMGAGALSNFVDPTSSAGQTLRNLMPIGTGMTMAGMALSVPQRVANVGNTVARNFQQNKNQEMMRQYQQQNPQPVQQPVQQIGTTMPQRPSNVVNPGVRNLQQPIQQR